MRGTAYGINGFLEITMTSSAKKTVHRSSESGQFVTKKYAENHPRTTERERVSVQRPAPAKKK